jgi:outer membrane usher protein
LRLIEGDYLTTRGRFGAQLAQTGTGVQGTLRASGSIAKLEGTGFHFGPRIYDGFAIVRSEAPDVPVSIENRLVGKTGSDGELLVADMRSYQNNAVSIDPTNLPLNATIDTTKKSVTVAARGGTVVDFGIDTKANAVVVHFVDAKGADIIAGTTGTIGGTPFVVGYDGLAYLQGIAEGGVATLELSDAECHARIDFKSEAAIQNIGPVACNG